jgi:hypothetical protein
MTKEKELIMHERTIHCHLHILFKLIKGLQLYQGDRMAKESVSMLASSSRIQSGLNFFVNIVLICCYHEAHSSIVG